MPKIKALNRTMRRSLYFRKVSSHVEVARVPTGAQGGRKSSLSGEFTACIRVGGDKRFGGCGAGRNPRQAIAAAMREAATLLTKTRGAFARYR